MLGSRLPSECQTQCVHVSWSYLDHSGTFYRTARELMIKSRRTGQVTVREKKREKNPIELSPKKEKRTKDKKGRRIKALLNLRPDTDDKRLVWLINRSSRSLLMSLLLLFHPPPILTWHTHKHKHTTQTEAFNFATCAQAVEDLSVDYFSPFNWDTAVWKALNRGLNRLFSQRRCGELNPVLDQKIKKKIQKLCIIWDH